MDWSIPQTFYPIALPTPWQWLLFTLAIAATALWFGRVVKYRGWRVGLLLLAPVALLSILTSMIVSMVLTFFLHDI